MNFKVELFYVSLAYVQHVKHVVLR